MKTKCLKSVFALFLLFASPMASAATYTVDRADDPDPTTAEACTAVADDCSLRGAVKKANGDQAPDDIIVPAGTYTLTIQTGNDENGENDTDVKEGDVDIIWPVTISGEGADVTTIVAGPGFDDRLFHARPQADGIVQFSGLTLDANHVPAGRGGVLFFKSAATTTAIIDGCHVKNGNGSDGGGVGMNDSLSLVIKNSTVSDNASSSRGGGLFCETGQCLVINSTFSNNTVNGVGGGAIDNSTGGLTLIHSTLVNNTAAAGNVGGGIRIGSTQGFTVKNSIFAGNEVDGAAENCGGDLNMISSGGYNLSDDASCAFAGTGDGNSVAVTIVSATLADNGGPVPTHLLPGGSPAIDFVPDLSCTDDQNAALITDQRGFTRPAGAGCDVGAVEVGCGNNNVEMGEECDDGNAVNDDSCTNDCKIPVPSTPSPTPTPAPAPVDQPTEEPSLGDPTRDPTGDPSGSDETPVEGPSEGTTGEPTEGGCQLVSGNEGSDPNLVLWMILAVGLLIRVRFVLRFLFLVLVPGIAFASTITVDTTVDELTNNGKCSLREAIRSANIDMPFDTCAAGSGVDKIVLPKGTYILSLVSTNEDAAMDGDLDIVKPLVILGEGQGTSILGNGVVTQDRIFDVRPGGILLLKDLGLFGGFHPSASGGGIYAEGPLGLLNCRVEGNIQGDPNQVGGAIATKNVNVTIANTSILNNQAVGSGGGIVLKGGQAVIRNSTIALNKAGKHVGGVVMIAGTLDLNNVTITANVADEDNTNDGDGGGLLSFGTVTIKNSIVSGNTDGSGQSHDCFGNIFSQGHNILGIKDGCAFSGLDGVDGDHVGTAASPKDPQLGPLAGNGGFTPTYSLLAGSPAIDGGNNGTCASSDQRGFTRPEDGDGDNTATCDIGALEIGCGNGVVEVFETCDDGNSDDTDACPTTCEIADCGDGFVQAGVEGCDDGNAVNEDTCTNSCVLPACGDGFLQAGEACDDGNATDGDGCTALCAVEKPAAPASNDAGEDSVNDEPTAGETTDDAEGLPLEQPEGSTPGGGGCSLLPSRGLS